MLQAPQPPPPAMPIRSRQSDHAMSKSERTQMLPRPTWADPRVHLLDDVWLLTIVAILVATGVPWFLSGFEVQLGAASWGLLVLGAVHWAFTSIAAPTRAHTQWRRRGLAALHLAGVVGVGYIWQHTGGVQNPVFLCVFALPVIAAIFVSDWHPYFTAAMAVAVVTVVALIQVPELRWYASGLTGLGPWLANLFGEPTAAANAPFSGFYAPASYFVVLLEVFAIVLFACAVAAEYLGTIFERLYSLVSLARAEAEGGQELWTGLIEQLPVPAFLIDVDTLQIVCASKLATQDFCDQDDAIEGRSLFDAVRFSYPEVVQELVRGADGVAQHAVIRVADEFRVAQVRVRHVAQLGHRFALALVEDTTEAFCVRTALDTAEHAALVIDARGRLCAFNKPASWLFAGLTIGMDAVGLLPQGLSGAQWWDPGVAGRRKMHVEIAPWVYQVTTSAVALPAEEERMYVVAFLPVGKAEVANQAATGSTLVSTTLAQKR
jgi:hypothetical protein